MLEYLAVSRDVHSMASDGAAGIIYHDTFHISEAESKTAELVALASNSKESSTISASERESSNDNRCVFSAILNPMLIF